MRRAYLERRRTLGEWRERLPVDEDLQPGRFRKGRTARGCPHRCTHCRDKKRLPSVQRKRVELNFAEWLRAL